MTSTQCRLWMESLDRSCSNGKISKKFEMFVDRSLNASHSRSDLGKTLALQIERRNALRHALDALGHLAPRTTR